MFDQVTGSLPHSSQQPLPAKALGGKYTIYKKQRSFEQSSEHIFFPQEFCHFPGGVRKDLYTKYTRKGPVQSDSMVSPPSLMFLKPLCPEQRAHSREHTKHHFFL